MKPLPISHAASLGLYAVATKPFCDTYEVTLQTGFTDLGLRANAVWQQACEQRVRENPRDDGAQRDRSVSFNMLRNLATAQGNQPEVQRLFGESPRMRL